MGRVAGPITNLFKSQRQFQLQVMASVLDDPEVDVFVPPDPAGFDDVVDWIDAVAAAESARGPLHGMEPAQGYALGWALWLSQVPYGIWSDRIADPSMREFRHSAERLEAALHPTRSRTTSRSRSGHHGPRWISPPRWGAWSKGCGSITLCRASIRRAPASRPPRQHATHSGCCGKGRRNQSRDRADKHAQRAHRDACPMDTIRLGLGYRALRQRRRLTQSRTWFEGSRVGVGRQPHRAWPCRSRRRSHAGPGGCGTRRADRRSLALAGRRARPVA